MNGSREIKGRFSKLPTSGRIGRIVKKLLAKVGVSQTKKIMKDAVTFDRLNPPAKAKYVREMVIRMKRTIGPAQSKEIMASCGMMCCGVTTRKAAQKAAQEATSLKDLIGKLNERHIGGGRLKLKNKNTIVGGYSRCYCGMVSKTRTRFPDLTYCHCSTGWYKQLFETSLKRPVQVKITRSIVCGAKGCEFEIKIASKQTI